MRLFSLLKVLLLAALLTGCAGHSYVPDHHQAIGKTVLLRVLKDEQNYSPEMMYIWRQNFKESRIYRHVQTAGKVEGTSFFVVATYNGYPRIPDSIPHLEKGDFIEVANPHGYNYDHDGGIFPVVIAVHCKGFDEECLKAKNAPKMYSSRIGRPLQPGEFEELRNPRHFTPFYDSNNKLLRPLPK